MVSLQNIFVAALSRATAGATIIRLAVNVLAGLAHFSLFGHVDLN
jgi:hypothetical protein